MKSLRALCKHARGRPLLRPKSDFRQHSLIAAAKFTELEKPLATRMYDDLVKTFTTGGYVDEETQRNDLAIVKLVAEVNDVVPIQKAYDFRFVRQAEQQLNKTGWKP